MKIAYIITAHKHPEQLIRLITRLNTETTCFLVHVDKKTDNQIYRRMVNGLSHLPNVHFLQRHRCIWGHFSLVETTIKGLSELFKRNIDFDYVLLLTGQDYPTKSNAHIHEFFRRNKGESFIEHFPIPSLNWHDENGGLDRIDYWHFWLSERELIVFPKRLRGSSPTLVYRVLARVWPLLRQLFRLKRRFPDGYRPLGGSAHLNLSRACAEYVHHFIRHQRGFVRFFKYVYVPDEIFFHTIILNSPLKDTVVNDDLRYVDWSTQPGPAVLGKNDFDKIVNSPGLFARKFDAMKDGEILDMIDQWTGVERLGERCKQEP